ncbi:DUF3108 domain-containing protein [Noviherbaspirillum sp. CPCC 100848]|uniref:DUF3108 domain-containing protein n=1 Tax=Noviherbaspirillum album TaxID=3080276 RepID=A0ABU6J5X3_9BURK|nr:DUF3108 domain-containing protein [Noviherbaspirillum sp. CPCC 100848]MEC4719057.1 DUF3108 domain-containing protein [Noviherbaspirillum sp. CPCC 100848]
MAIFLSTDIRDAKDVKDKRRQRLRRRAIVLVCASVLAHLFAFRWAEGRLDVPAWRNPPAPAVTTISLLASAPVPPAVPAAQEEPALPPPKKPKPKKSRPKKSIQKDEIVPPVAAAAQETAAVLPPAGMEAPGTSVEALPLLIPDAPDAVADADSAADAEVIAGAAAEAIHADAGQEQTGPAAESLPEMPKTTQPYKVDLPPSARLDYDVEALVKGQKWYGSGNFRWEAGPDSYSMSGEASTLLLLVKITVLNFRSEGRINEFGIAPLLYSEKPRNKSLTHTHFQHDNGKISFSASEKTYPYQGGEQDRASVMWQIAGIGRADPARFAPGAEFEVFVAGARDAEPWRIRVLGLEEITTAAGKAAAWHLVRAPRQKSFDQTIEFWLAPQQEWYPLRIRHSSPNGDMLDMTLADIQR